MKKKTKPTRLHPILFSAKGAGRLDDSQPIYLSDCIAKITEDRQQVFCYVPEKITLSEQIGGAVYDVTGVFDRATDKSLLRQLRDLLVSKTEA